MKSFLGLALLLIPAGSAFAGIDSVKCTDPAQIRAGAAQNGIQITQFLGTSRDFYGALNTLVRTAQNGECSVYTGQLAAEGVCAIDCAFASATYDSK